MMHISKKMLLAFTLFTLSSFSLSHSGHADFSSLGSLASGALHPILGWDHLLTLLLTGFVLSQLPDKLRKCGVFVFIALMAIGYSSVNAGLEWFSPSSVETCIFVSLVVSGIFVSSLAIGRRIYSTLYAQLPIVGAITLGLFSVAHGAAHAFEVSVGASVVGFGLGFLGMSFIILITGVWLGIRLLGIGVVRYSR